MDCAALLNFDGKHEKVRTVKLEPLDPETWVESEVAMIIAAVPLAIRPKSNTIDAEPRRWFWKKIIPTAYYTGLERIDLCNRFDNSVIDNTGLVVTRRHKTKKQVIAQLPFALAFELRNKPSGPLFRYQPCKEFFRREFKKIVLAAGLTGTFKKLRKTSGTESEIEHPGHGHELLANSRAIFEKHYLGKRALRIQPRSPRELPAVG